MRWLCLQTMSLKEFVDKDLMTFARFKRNSYFLSYYLRSLFGQKRPLLGGIKLTHKCNLTCDHCPFWKKAKDSLSFDQAVSAMKTLHKRGVRILIFEGGEPFLWKDGDYDIRDIVKEARKLFFSIGITTNGTFPLEADADIIWVSIDGLKETHDKLRCGSYNNVITNIKASSHPRIYAHTTINSVNWKEIPELVQFLNNKVKGITIQFHYPYEEGEKDLSLSLNERQKVLDDLIKMKKQGLPVANSYACLKALKNNQWKCHPWMIASVEPDGKITHGCYVKNRGKIACDKCGFSAHTEISLAYSGVLESIRLGNKIFG